MLDAIDPLFFTPQGSLQRDVVITLIALLLGFAVAEITSRIKEVWRSQKEVRDNQFIDLSGQDWFAAWETSVDGAIVINTEHVSISQRGANVFMRNTEKSPENPIGGYLWRSKLIFSHGETLMGWYYPIKEENLTSRGIMYFSYDAQRKLFAGKWVGKSYDGSLCNGFVCISKDRARSKLALAKLIEQAKKHPVNILGGIPFEA